MHEEGNHATNNQLSGSLVQGDGLEKRLEQWECILHDQHGRLLPQGLANGPLPHHHFAQIRRKKEVPPFEPTHVEKKRNFKTCEGGAGGVVPARPVTGASLALFLSVLSHHSREARRIGLDLQGSRITPPTPPSAILKLRFSAAPKGPKQESPGGGNPACGVGPGDPIRMRIRPALKGRNKILDQD